MVVTADLLEGLRGPPGWDRERPPQGLKSTQGGSRKQDQATFATTASMADGSAHGSGATQHPAKRWRRGWSEPDRRWQDRSVIADDHQTSDLQIEADQDGTYPMFRCR
ncbi:hypothetical protein AA309_15520 [Microvirga vignae]|uniref:Uncharacterized protein n=1 Tax=Microvirga vignae TaxID=1225564 RepID=A0A0H1RB22_9HYPH|nr:hypothetical protein AA309_15520 [Microvirga vignae]